ncbi:SPOR domain-containing protein [Marivivens donghaensis]|uniref:SPOR domain-containing protein n=1 Tax=Marivivens donghaensis TaxID=1699413 RepID=A0ABX0VWG2_9RHOB|nr:SPOR domain-containing protein [Marivivens donghaensis]NIY72154.1 SPOR domain-containing protein [Marivivens donghaensis]
MSGKVMAHFRTTVLSVAALAFVAGCSEDGGMSFFNKNSGSDETLVVEENRSVELIERDVEAPQVFQVTENGLWDGRPSLGGVWVAHPDVQDPERVIVRNLDNGKFVIGALFRRERENPGPALQASSDAAAALGMLAGAPAQLQVTALRREEAPAQVAEATPTFDEGAEVETMTLDPIAGAEAAIAAAEAAQAAPAPMPEAAPAPEAPAPAAPATSDLAKPFIQIGIFSIEENATRTADRLRTTEIVPTVLEQSSQGRTFWRVIVGPAAFEAERADLLTRIKAQGFTDAYFVTN